ncbi:MAG: DUF342 domain-containing protein [Agathobacter sp.]|nr:DUF342 domain-containing protein [Agathobacter sp.]
MKNQYFQLEFRDTIACLHIYPPVDGGKMLSITEVTEYLAAKKLDQYNLKELNAAIVNHQDDSVIMVGDWDGIPIREEMKVNISLDKMKVTCRFYPPSAGSGKVLNAEDIISDLAFRKVKYGIDQEAVLSFLNDRQYCTDYVFALGTQPVHGKDAKIEYFFNTSKNLQPKRNEDGSVDYKELNTISHIQKGDLLARLIKEDPGKPGKNVFGEEIKPRTVRTAKLQYGNKISINEEKTEIYSDVTGHANLVNEKVFVSDVYDVPADVDNSVGNIQYDGSVEIKGNVKTGFMVRATGDIIIHGVVENAFVEAGGQIIVKQGIHGMHKGMLQAGTNVMAKYIENAKVSAGGFVEAEAILNSDVSARGEVRVQGKKGLINGGTIRAGRSIEVMYAGTEMGTFTTLEVGVDPEKKERYLELKKDVSKRAKDLEDMKVIIDNYASMLKKGEVLPKDKLLYVQNLALEYKMKKEELEPLRNEMRVIHIEMMESDRSYIAVTRTIFPGVVLSISDLGYSIKDKMNYCKFKKVDGAIKSVGF